MAVGAESSRKADGVARRVPRNGSEKWGDRDDQLPSMRCAFAVRFSFASRLLWFEAGWQGPGQWAPRTRSST